MKISSKVTGIVAVLSASVLSLQAQLMPAAPTEEDEFIYELVGWDFTGMDDPAVARVQMILDPIAFNQELDRYKSATELAQEAESGVAITDPDEYRRTHPQPVDPAREAAEAIAWFAILNPVLNKQILDSEKTPEQLQDEQTSNWEITHPSNKDTGVTVDEAIVTKPTPILKEIPLPKLTDGTASIEPNQ